MAKKKPDYSDTNIPALTRYCNNNGLLFNWKDKEQGHAVILNQDVEAYIWVQRMTIGVRKRNGVELSRTLYDRPIDYHFSKKFLNNLLFTGVKQTVHTTKQGIKVRRVPAGVK